MIDDKENQIYLIPSNALIEKNLAIKPKKHRYRKWEEKKTSIKNI